VARPTPRQGRRNLDQDPQGGFKVQIDYPEGSHRRRTCWGWIDGIRKGFDNKSYLQRYTRRTKKSIWSQINVDNVARLVNEGRMTEHGLREVDRAKSDGRWARAYRSGKDMKIPDDLQVAIDAEPKAKAMLLKLSAQNRFALAFRTHHMKTEAGRKKKIAAFVAMLKRGETIYPQSKK
jgi:uncharacterized protein YdeI (YjbR/CyaY-like superfamily)